MTPDERKQLRSEVRLVQSIQRANGDDVTGIHETERGIMERRKVEEALEKAQPTFLSDGHGLRGPQQSAPLQIDGAEGWGNSVQVKRKRGGEAEGATAGAGAAPAPNKIGRFVTETGGVWGVETLRFYGTPA